MWIKTVAAPRTETKALRVVVPPVPVQFNSKVVPDDIGPTIWLPDNDLLPLHPPVAEHDVALELDQVKVVLAFASTSDGLADIDTVGADEPDTVTVTDRLVVPPPPLHVSVYVPVLPKPVRV